MRVPTLLRASLGFLIRHPWQVLLALSGIAVGVAAVLAVDLATSSARAAFLLSLDTLNGQSTHRILGGPRGVDERLYVRLKRTGSAADLAPVFEGSVEVGQQVLSVLGVDPFAERGFRAFTLPPTAADDSVADLGVLRRFLIEPGAALMARDTQAALGLETGQDIVIVANGRERTLTLVGSLPGSDPQYRNLVVVDIATAQEWFASPGFLTHIDVRATPAVADALQAELPVDTRLVAAAMRTRASADMTGAFMTNLTAMSLLALLVSVFLIYNSVSFAVVQRRRIIGLLRALGLTSRQTCVLVLTEGLALGLVGAVLGVFAGIALGERLLLLVSQSINDLYFRVAVTEVELAQASIVKAIAAGLLVTGLASLVPALEAARLKPNLSLSRSVHERHIARALPWLSALGLLAAGAGFLLLATSGQHLTAGLVALFLLVLGFAACIPIATRWLTGTLAPYCARVGGTVARQAVDGVRASLSRTGVAVVALSVAVSATIGVSVMVDSFRGAVEDWLAGTLQADLYVGVASGALEPSIIDDIAALPQVLDLSSSRRVWIDDREGPVRLGALSMAAGSYAGVDLMGAKAQPTWYAFEEEEAVLVSAPYAYRRAVAAGDRVNLLTDSGRRDFTIAAVYQSYDADGGAVLMSRTTYDRHWSDPAVDTLGLYVHNGIDATQLAARVQALGTDRQALRVASKQALTETSMQIFDRTFVITDVLYWLAVGVAIVGILGAMLAVQLERARELAVLRALGVTPGELAAMVVGQTSVIGVLSGVAALPLGLLMAWVLIEVVNRRAFGWDMSMSVDLNILAGALLLAIGAAIAAGVYPAYRAARSLPAAAMREE